MSVCPKFCVGWRLLALSLPLLEVVRSDEVSWRISTISTPFLGGFTFVANRDGDVAGDTGVIAVQALVKSLHMCVCVSPPVSKGSTSNLCN